MGFIPQVRHQSFFLAHRNRVRGIKYFSASQQGYLLVSFWLIGEDDAFDPEAFRRRYTVYWSDTTRNRHRLDRMIQGTEVAA